MSEPDLASLLAPTWKARARAEDALMSWIFAQSDGKEPWPEPVQCRLRALSPSPEVFLRALVGFWADIVAREFQARMRKTDDPWAAWRDDTHATLFPMTPAQPKASEYGMRGMWVWKFLERLGDAVGFVEGPLVDGLEHPESIVWSSAEEALGSAPTLSDAGFARFLDSADRRGRNGSLYLRAPALARHVDAGRVALLFDGLVPQAPDELHWARFAILGRLEGDVAALAMPRLAALLAQPFTGPGLGALLRALTALSATAGVDPAVPAAVRALATHADPEIRGEAAAFVAQFPQDDDAARLHAFAIDPHPWVRLDLCRGLATRLPVDVALVRAACARSLGDYDGHDGEPHDSAIALLLHDPAAAAQVLPEIVRWWDSATTGPYLDREPIQQALQLCAALAPHTDLRALLPGLERALAWLTEPEATVELPGLDQPGAVPIVREHLEQSMLAAGTEPAQAAAVADLHGAALAEFAASLEQMQAEIDESQARWEAEQRELYPERFEDTGEDDGDGEDDDETCVEEEDELAVAVRAMIERLRAGTAA